MRFSKQVILVTGGGSGIGFAAAKRLVSEGATVVITGRNKAKLDQAVAELGSSASAFVADVSRLEDLDRLYGYIRDKHRGLDGLFANAGIAINEPISQVTEKSFDQLMNTNVKGVFFTLQKAAPLLRRGSAIVVNSSVLATKGSPGSSTYGASKAAVRAFARSFSAEFIPAGIRVNVVSPGPIDTAIWDSTTGAELEAKKVALAQSVPMKRMGKAEDVASAVAFLLSDDSSFIAGDEIHVDGGRNQL